MANLQSNRQPDTQSRLILRQPDDWHVHLRDGEMLDAVVNFTARQCARAIVMPNLPTPVTDVQTAIAYRDRINAAVDKTHDFTPLMICYLTDATDPKEVERGFHEGVFTACKLYPANATTNSAHGVTDITKIYAVLEVMQNIGMPLLVHGEVTDADIDIFDREAVFIERVLKDVIVDFPGLKIVFEHITTKDGVDFVREAEANIGATITPHHLEFNRNAMLVGGMQPHYYCLPVAKRELHRLALRKAATSGSPKFFFGTDSAPHVVGSKESACGCAGLFNATHAIESYAKVFEEEGALDKLEGFASEHGPHFYGLPLNEKRIILDRTPNLVPATVPVMDTHIVPFHADTKLAWKFVGFE
ncbi:MAG: dihydroorotase [Robiginitomaculum sp.]|nr:MAG: dihydroorotase [Robiginitomaculum sp.]